MGKSVILPQAAPSQAEVRSLLFFNRLRRVLEA
jgi:hypothetical protein